MHSGKNRKLNRIPGYDYAQDNAYFITGCVQNRVCCLGTVRDRIMQPNIYGQIASERLLWLEEQYPYVRMPHYTAMPNHIHAIIEINTSQLQSDIAGDAGVLKVKSLSSLLGAYKTTSSKLIHEAGLPEFSWQRSFHDHIIRNETEYRNIASYIENNASNWDKDTFFTYPSA